MVDGCRGVEQAVRSESRSEVGGCAAAVSRKASLAVVAMASRTAGVRRQAGVSPRAQVRWRRLPRWVEGRGRMAKGGGKAQGGRVGGRGDGRRRGRLGPESG